MHGMHSPAISCCQLAPTHHTLLHTHSLSHTPTLSLCTSQVLGAKKKNLAGFSTATLQPHQGFVYGCAVLQQTPPAHRVKAARLIAAKCTLMARVDAYGHDPSVSQL